MAAKTPNNIKSKKAVLWQQISQDDIASRGQRHLFPEKSATFRMSKTELDRTLKQAPLEFSAEARTKEVILNVPKPDGSIARFRIEEAPLFSPEIARQFPTWKTYQGFGVDDPNTTARFDWTDSGFHGYVFSPEGTFSIDPYQVNDTENYIVFYKKEHGATRRNFHCRLDEMLSEDKSLEEVVGHKVELENEFVHGTQLRNYRLAIATTFEYTAFFRQAGDTDAQAQTRAFAAVTTSVNRITGVYRKEVAVTFTLVSSTNLTFVTNPESPADYANNGSSADLNQNQTNVDTILGSANYDVAHLYETTDSGVAQLQSVCAAGGKARGLSGQPAPQGDPFDVDYVAHEMGHQFGGNHTFNSTANCNASPAAARREPGSAVTIMGYAGICSSTSNVQRNSIDTFHVYNLQEIINFITTGGGTSCGTLSGTNQAPVITPLSNFTIPFNTPFSLTATANDPDNDPITYNWEQSDPSASPSSYPNTVDDDDVSLVFRPGFRSYLPTVGSTRSFPSLPYILNNANEAPVTFTGTSPVGSICAATCITGEDLPSAARTMNFRVSVRDGRGGISDAGTVLTVVNTTTPFRVTAPNTAVTWNGNSSQTITWDVSGTNAGTINAANVRILLSTDGGQTFPTVLAASTANDGSEAITVPAVDTTQARIKVEAVGNIFFDISNANFTIVSTPASSGILSGRILNGAGYGIPNVKVTISGGSFTDVVYTNSFGIYTFSNVPFGQSYTITPTSTRKYTITPTSLNVTLSGNVNNANFSTQSF